MSTKPPIQCDDEMRKAFEGWYFKEYGVMPPYPEVALDHTRWKAWKGACGWQAASNRPKADVDEVALQALIVTAIRKHCVAIATSHVSGGFFTKEILQPILDDILEAIRPYLTPADDRALVEEMEALKDSISEHDISRNPKRFMVEECIAIVQSHTATQNEKLREVLKLLQPMRHLSSPASWTDMPVDKAIKIIEQLIKGEMP